MQVVRRLFLQRKDMITKHQSHFIWCMQVVRRLHSDSGWRAFYKGLLPEYLKVIPSVSIAFCTYELMRTLLRV